ncbi:MAG: efflux transporter outer membrane subunit [Pseudomonadota bacterium]|nr:efflux transporter outer membrane subunit [Pseudomonadota bacterium]
MIARLNEIGLGLAALLLSACALGPDYERPTQDVPALYRGQTNSDRNALGDADWRAVYAEPALQALIDTALQANLDMQIAASRVDQARAVLGTQRVQQLPEINGVGALSRGQSSEYAITPGQARIGEHGSLDVSLSWELDFWGRLRRLGEAARADYLGSVQGERAVRVSLIANVASAYYSLCALSERSDAAARSVEARESFLKLTQAQSQRGVISGLDVASAEAQLAAAQVSVHDLIRQRQQTENALSVLLARQAQANDPGQCAAPVAAGAGLPSRLLERRPDVLQAEQALVSANAKIGAAKAALFPSLSLTGAFGSLSTDVSELLTAPAETWSIGVGLLQPLLNADRNLYQVDLSQARKREALLQYEKTVRTAFREVADALIAQSANAEVFKAQQAQVAALRRAEDIAQARYRAGYSSYFDVINADRDLFAAEQAQAQAKLALKLATVDLYRALGGGWDNTAPATPAQ